MKKRWFIMGILGLSAMFAACDCNAGTSAGTAANTNKINTDFKGIVDNFIDTDIPKKTSLVTPREGALIDVVSLTVQQSDAMFKDRIARILDKKLLSPEEILEAVYQCAPYSGMSRAMDAANKVAEILVAKNISISAEMRASVSGVEDRFKKGTDAQIELFGEHFKKIQEAGKDNVPLSNYFLAINCFGDYYTRKGLTLKDREFITMVMLVNLGVEPQLRAHIAANLGVGRSPEFLEQAIYRTLPYSGYPKMLNAQSYLKDESEKFYHAKKTSPTHKLTLDEYKKQTKFPVGAPNDSYAKYFIGQSYLASVYNGKPGIHNVTFEPACRNNWHIHHKSAQVLIAVDGEGWYQIEGKPAKKLHAGETVEIPEGTKHWHGATKGSWFQHFAFFPSDGATTEWLEPVTDDVYNQLK